MKNIPENKKKPEKETITRAQNHYNLHTIIQIQSFYLPQNQIIYLFNYKFQSIIHLQNLFTHCYTIYKYLQKLSSISNSNYLQIFSTINSLSNYIRICQLITIKLSIYTMNYSKLNYLQFYYKILPKLCQRNYKTRSNSRHLMKINETRLITN